MSQKTVMGDVAVDGVKRVLGRMLGVDFNTCDAADPIAKRQRTDFVGVPEPVADNTIDSAWGIIHDEVVQCVSAKIGSIVHRASSTKSKLQISTVC